MGSVIDEDSQALASGLRLEEFEILNKIGDGGFSIVYKAWDRLLEREVALKEYLPSSIAFRSNQTQVGVRSERNRAGFEAGLASFVREAQTLASFNHPGLVRVFRFFQANGTAYMVMPLYVGRTLRAVVQEMPDRPDEAWLLHLLHPLMDVLERVHSQDWYHRDIAPDNIMLVDGESRPILLDFGAARQVVGDMTQALTVVLKPGYAPIEQYAAIAEIKQGPWTDVYALAATVHWAITGKTPPIAAGRILQDSHIPLAVAAKGRYSEKFLAGLDAALKVKPADRTQSIAHLRNDLSPLPVAEPAAPQQTDASCSPDTRPQPETLARPQKKAAGQKTWIGIALFFGLMACGFGLFYLLRTPPRTAVISSPVRGQPLAVDPGAAASSHRQQPHQPPVSASRPFQQPVPALVKPLPTPAKSATEVSKARQIDKPTVLPMPVKKPAARGNPACDELLRRLSLGEADSDLQSQLSANGCSGH